MTGKQPAAALCPHCQQPTLTLTVRQDGARVVFCSASPNECWQADADGRPINPHASRDYTPRVKA